MMSQTRPRHQQLRDQPGELSAPRCLTSPGATSSLLPVSISSKQAFGSLGGSVAHCPTAQLRSQILVQTFTRWAGKCSPSQPKTAALWEACSHAGPGWHLGTWMLEGHPPCPGKKHSLCPHCCANDEVYAEGLLSGAWNLGTCQAEGAHAPQQNPGSGSLTSSPGRQRFTGVVINQEE